MYQTKLSILCVILCVELSIALPQKWNSFSNSNQGFNWAGKSNQGSGRGYGGDEDAEMIPSTILEEHQDYNVVRYPASKWVCTKDTVDTSYDPMKNWQTDFDNDPMAAWRAKKKLNMPSSKMFKKLFRYIIGVNSQQANIEMTRPVTTIRQKVKGSNRLEVEVMCFWTGSPWEYKELPEPMDNSVFIQNRPELTVFVRRFGGYAMSEKQWKDEKSNLMNSLGSRLKEVDMDYYATVGYNSPWSQDRRNEVWLVKQKDSVYDAKHSQKASSGSPSEISEKEDLETVPYEVLESKQNYELRQYPATKWVCNTQKDVVPSEDAMNGWQERYNNNPMRAMSSKDWKKQASSKMFMKLFKFISGVNTMGEEIEMTTPVPVKHIPTGDDKEDMKMCFWLGKEWEDKDAPEPLSKDAATTKIYQGKGMKVYVHKYGGFAMSHNDYIAHYNKLVEALKQDGVKYKTDGQYMHVGYNSPFEMKNRRNEIWVEAEDQ